MNDNQNISFIMPAYNCADTIVESVESIFKDNFEQGDELIIIDDASTDKTLETIKSLQKKYPEIKTVSHNINKGSAAAGRNTGIDFSKNELIFCLDADNILAPNSIYPLKSHMLKNKAEVGAFGELRYFKKDKKEINHKWIFKKNQVELQDALTGYYWPGPSGNYLFTKKSWKISGRYEETLGGAYDSWAFGIKQLGAGFKIIILEDSFYYHRYGYDSTFIREENKVKASLVGLSVLIKFLPQINDSDIEYIMSSKHRYSWFENLEKKPIRLKNNKIGINGTLINYQAKKDTKDIIEPKYKKYLKSLKNFFK
ncbi:MAG: glycosyltransferase family 2 protein [bacterium]